MKGWIIAALVLAIIGVVASTRCEGEKTVLRQFWWGTLDWIQVTCR